VVLYPGVEKPVVLCALDWLGVGNTSQDLWKAALARAAGTEPARVAVHAVHQHDAPGDDASAGELLGADNVVCSRAFAETARARVAAAVKSATPRLWTHVSAGQAKVERIASNRRIVSAEGRFLFQRFTACRNSPYCAEPEGVIDPMLQSIGLWSGEERVATLQYYATHPMSHYGKGVISADFVGLARDAQDGFCAYFTGAAGNIGAGKYNDGAPERRQELAARLAEAMRRARAAETKERVERVSWRAVMARLAHRRGAEFSEQAILAAMRDTNAELRTRASAARYLAWRRLADRGRDIPIGCLDLGVASIVHFPGEAFVEYQLAAQREARGRLVAMAAYGDYGPMYIGTARSYGEGGYETSGVSRVGPEAEEVLLETLKKGLRA
jgi:hypothetical protein